MIIKALNSPNFSTKTRANKDYRNYAIVSNNFLNETICSNKALLIFDNSISFEQSDFNHQLFKKIYLVFNGNDTRQIKLNEKVLDFKKSLINNEIENLKKRSLNCKIINIQELKDTKEDLLALYPCVGENLDYIKSNSHKNIHYLYRKIDQYSWRYCNKGFFNFKNYIPKIVQEFI